MIERHLLTDYILYTKKAVIFDMDGTMVHNMPYHAQAWQRFAHQQGIEVTYEDLHAGLSGTASQYLSKLLNLQDHSQLKRLEDEKEEIYRDIYQSHIEEIEGLTPFIAWLKANHKLIGLATLGNPANVKFTLSHLALMDYFDDIKHGEDITLGKPNPEIYLKSLASLGVEAKDAIAFEDSKGGVLAAKAAGIEVVGIETSNDKKALLEWGVIATTPDYLFL